MIPKMEWRVFDGEFVKDEERRETGKVPNEKIKWRSLSRHYDFLFEHFFIQYAGGKRKSSSMETDIVVRDSTTFKIEEEEKMSSHSGLKTERPKVPKILVPKIDLVDIKKTGPMVIVTPTGRGRLQKQSSAKLNCLCSPTTHAGSFRCRHHRTSGLSRSGGSIGSNLSDLAAKSSGSISNTLQAQ